MRLGGCRAGRDPRLEVTRRESAKGRRPSPAEAAASSGPAERLLVDLKAAGLMVWLESKEVGARSGREATANLHGVYTGKRLFHRLLKEKNTRGAESH